MAPNINKSITGRIRDLLEDMQKYAVVIYTNDHPPAHIHFKQGERIAVAELIPNIRIRSNKGFNNTQLGEIIELATYFREFMLDKWDEFHSKRM